jgi:adenosylcobinamide-phosphate synthase
MFYAIQVLIAYFLDLLLGDPRSLPHPVRLIGRFCSRCEEFFRARTGNATLAGTLTVAAVLSATAAAATLILLVLAAISPWLAGLAAVILLYTCLAARDLAGHSREVYHRLQAGDLPAAREAVAMIVGRETASLDREGVCRAAVETVAENTVDGVTAPIFTGICCSLLAPLTGLGAIELTAVGALLYKAANTMDSMFGYKNDRYIHFGMVAARLDDVLNYLPARLTPLFLVLAAAVLKLDWRGASRIFFRDRLCHASPNAGHPEAAVAGALGVRLGGPSRYFGKVVEKPFIGDDLQPIQAEDILRTNRLMYLGSLLLIVFLLGCRYLLVEG